MVEATLVKGGMWTSLFLGLAVLFAVAIVYTPLNQIHEHTLQPSAVDHGVSADGMDLIELMWLIVPAAAVIAFLYNFINEGRRQGGDRVGY